ncbi:MAG: hypothetical protein HY707_08940 [Ignavibacteriae bacterium]|nr:hypothetical protein [Ignavibacteriota bacterium]
MQKKKIIRINWHNAFGQILKHRWTPLGLQVIPEYEVAKNPLKIDVVVIRSEAVLSERKRGQLPDGIRDYLNAHNIIDFKSTHESYGLEELRKTDVYTGLYQIQEGINLDQVTAFAVASMTPKKLLNAISQWVHPQGNGVYVIESGLIKMILLVPNEMEPKTANDVFELFASHTERSQLAFERMITDSFWYSLDGTLNLFTQFLKEFAMSGLTMRQLEENPQIGVDNMREVVRLLRQKKPSLLRDLLQDVDDSELEQILKERKKKRK